jgi:serine/threonine protein kinase
VYLAKWRETLVAVKILMNTGVDIEDADDAERALTLSNPVLESLEKEASMMAALRHPNVVAFLGVCATPPCVATEYCARGSLTDVLRGGKNSAAKAKQLDWARRLNMALDAAKGMHYLHEHSPPIIHRDLKSPNLLVDKHWRVKVSDFNLSKLMEENSVMSSMAATNPRWLAPEILAGQPASYESDVYAFGVVLWELLTWELPWGATNPWQVVTFVTEGGRLEIPARERLPGPDSATWGELDAYVRLVQRCWAQIPQDRPRFKEVIADLRDMLERTLSGKGSLGGASGPSRGATASPTLASGAGTLSAFGSGVPLPPTPSSPGPLGSGSGGSAAAAPGSVQARGRLSSGLSGVSRTASETGTGGSGYSSMAAEVGSLDDGMPRTLLGSSVQRSQ